MPPTPNLTRQKRLAMALFGAGQRKVWLDPAKALLIERAKSRTRPANRSQNETIR